MIARVHRTRFRIGSRKHLLFTPMGKCRWCLLAARKKLWKLETPSLNRPLRQLLSSFFRHLLCLRLHGTILGKKGKGGYSLKGQIARMRNRLARANRLLRLLCMTHEDYRATLIIVRSRFWKFAKRKNGKVTRRILVTFVVTHRTRRIIRRTPTRLTRLRTFAMRPSLAQIIRPIIH